MVPKAKAESGSVGLGAAPSTIPLSDHGGDGTSVEDGSVTVTGTFADEPLPVAGSNMATFTV